MTSAKVKFGNPLPYPGGLHYAEIGWETTPMLLIRNDHFSDQLGKKLHKIYEVGGTLTPPV